MEIHHLISNGTDIDGTNNDGNIALYMAAEYNETEVVESLLSN